MNKRTYIITTNELGGKDLRENQSNLEYKKMHLALIIFITFIEELTMVCITGRVGLS